MAMEYSSSGMENLTTKINALIDEKYESAKAQCTAYGELKKSLEKTTRDITWESPEIAAYVGDRFRARLDEEMKNSKIRPEGSSGTIRGLTIDLSSCSTQKEGRREKLKKQGKRKKVLYLCDGKNPECGKNNCYLVNNGPCKWTTNIGHAVNFKKRDGGSTYYRESERSS